MQTATTSRSVHWSGFTSLFSRNGFGEMRVLSALRGLDPAAYRHFHNLDLPHPTERGTLRIEHVVVSQFGVFVIKTTKRRGWISGFEHDPEWVQLVHRRRNRIQNPLLQNRVMVDALMKFLKLPDPAFLPMVVFLRDCQFKSPLPGTVVHSHLVPWIRRHTVTLLDAHAAARAVSSLEAHQNPLNPEAAGKLQLHTLHVRQAV